MASLAVPLLAAALQAPSAPLPGSGGALGRVALAALAAVALLALFVARYRRCPANKVLVISGKVRGGETAKCISGGGAFVWPVIQEYAYLDLEPIQIDIPLTDAMSSENIRVAVPSVFTVAIGTGPDVRQNAAIRLLGLDRIAITEQARDIIFGQLRQVIASMTIDEITRDREALLQKIQQSLEPELGKIGLVLINVNITDLRDDAGYIEAVARKAAAQAVQQARADVAEQEKLGEVRVAEVYRDRDVQVANAEKQREIAVRENERDQAVRVAELTKEQQVVAQMAALEREAAQRQQAVRLAQFEKEQRIGEQTAAFERDVQIKEAEQKKRIAIANADARAIAGEAESQAAIAAAQAQLSLREAEAFQLAETKKREAEAAVAEAEARAQARAAVAHAERVEAEQRAAIEAPARAEKARTIVEAEAAAEQRVIEARAEAAAIYVKLEAEARGQYELLAKKGEGLRKIVQACGGAREAYQLLMLERVEALAHTAATAISNVKFDKVVVWDGGAGGAAGAAGFLHGIGRSLPPMMEVLRDIAGVELPEFVGKMSPEVIPVPALGDEARRNAAGGAVTGSGTADAGGTPSERNGGVTAPAAVPNGASAPRVPAVP